jgi:CheY-like chemotaxis protein
MRVLYVDDNATNRRVMEWQIRPLGVRLTAVGSAAAALTSVSTADAARDPYRVALLDHLMPEMDGVRLAEALRSFALTAPPSLVILSSSAEKLRRADAERLGFAALLRKPIKRRALTELLVRLYDGADRREQEAPVPRIQELGLRVLLAEDNPINQRIACLMLERTNCRVVVVDDGAEAVERFRTETFDAVLMDVQMPVMGGLDAARAIRRLEAEGGRPRTPIIALTANAMAADRAECLAAGMDGHLAKRIQIGSLAEALAHRVPAAACAASDRVG